MPPKRRSTTLARARRRLRGVLREDSDDELGVEDLPWEWMRSAARGDVDERIFGAKMGSFNVCIGDCVLVAGEELKGEAYVGLVCGFEEQEEGEKMAEVQWFSTEAEISNKTKRRRNALPNELYMNPHNDDIPLLSINGRAAVHSAAEFKNRYPSGVPKSSKEYGKVFICRRACNVRSATYSDEFIWEEIYKGRDTDINHIQEFVRESTKVIRGKLAPGRPTRLGKRRREDDMELDGDDDRDRDFKADDFDDNDETDADFDERKAPRTPRKKRQKSNLTTPSRRTPAGSKYTTPTHKRITVKKPLMFTPLASRVLSPATHLSTPYAIARHRLHVSTLPPSLPCRDEEFAEVYTHLSAAIADGSGSCIYISGTPGTGKTATVREVISQLQHLVTLEEIDDFTFVEINGMKVVDPHQSYALLWEAMKGERVSSSQALGLLEHEFSTPSPRRVPCVVLMDELDQLVTRGQGVMYNFFNWPGQRYSRLIVLAVANTMDLPERTLSNKISSRLGLTRITFPGYTHEQLITIIKSRLEGVPGNIVDPDAIQFASRKVAAVSGDARRALDICRRAVEMVEYAADEPSTPSKHRPGVATGGGLRTGGRVTIATVKRAIQESTSSPLMMFLKLLPFTSKLFLAALLARVRRSGVADNILADVYDQSDRMLALAEESVRDILSGGAREIGLPEAVAALADAGIIGVEQKRGERGGRVRVLVSEEDVKAALRGDLEVGRMFG